MGVKVFVYRHTETVNNAEGIFSGTSETELTKRGVAEAKLVAQKFKGVKIDLAYASPLKRSKDCLGYILKNHPETQMIIDKRLIERDYGKLTGLNKKEYADKYPQLFPAYHRSYLEAPPEGESMKQVDDRVTEFIEEMKKTVLARKAKNVIICGHGNSMRPIRKYFERLSPEEMMKIETPLGAVLEYSWEIN